MKKRISAFLLCLLTLCTAFIHPAYAAEIANDTVNEAKELIGGIAAFKMDASGASTAQEWIEKELSASAGIGAEWYILALSHDPTLDFSAYSDALLRYLSENTVTSASTRQKYALVLASCGETGDYLSDVMENTIGQLGIMSWVYGLHLMNNGFESTATGQDAAIEQLLSLQSEDGGWALRAGASDVDVTAMVIQSLAPFYGTHAAVTESIDRALLLLSEKQLENGDYSSYGVSNPESVSQVLIALSCLGIDALTDTRFIKNDNTLLDGLSRYRLADGSFCHTLSGPYNPNATSQTFLALSAYLLMHETGENLFSLTPRESSGESSAPLAKSLDYKSISAIIISAAAVLGCLILVCMKKRSFKNYIFILIAAALLILIVYTTSFETAESYYTAQAPAKKDPIGSVTLSIRCDSIVGIADSEYIPADGIILDAASFPIEEGDTVYTVLTDAARAHGLQMDNSGPQGMAYISGLNYLYELQFGDLSGWIYFVNGESPSVGCDQYVLKDGDHIEWLYTLQMGEDLRS